MSGSDVTPCIKIDKSLVVYAFSIVNNGTQKCDFNVMVEFHIYVPVYDCIY